MALVTHPRFRRHCQTIFFKTEIRPISSPFVSQLQFSPNPVFLLISLSYLINFSIFYIHYKSPLPPGDNRATPASEI